MQGDPRQPVVIPAEAAGAGVPNSALFGSLKPLCGAATWRPPGGITLTFNHHFEGHRLVLSPGSTTTTTRFSELRHLPVPAARAACGLGTEPENKAYPESVFGLNGELGLH